MSKGKPKRSQLTQSDYLSRVWDLQDNFELDSAMQPEDIRSTLEEIISELETLRDECEEKRDAMPEHLQDTSDAGNLLQERYDQLESAIYALESIELDDPPGYEDEIETDHEAYSAWVGEIQSEASSALSEL